MNTRKIGILNFQYSDHNYGAVIQACALHYVIKNNIGVDVTHINLIPEVKKKKFFIRMKNKIGFLLRELGIKNGLIQHEYFKNPYVFEDFRNMYLPRTKELNKNNIGKYCATLNLTHVIVGSDQVWRPDYTQDLVKEYFFDFISDDVKKISYAASFGLDKWEYYNKWISTDEVKRLIKRFSAISVRENTGLEICRREFDVCAEHVLDPTLIVNKGFYSDILEKANKDPVSDIVYYKLDLDNRFRMLIKQIEDERKYNSENIYYKKNIFSYRYNSVPDWLAKINNSKLVVTDSFHCICFSIIFEKDFIYYPNKDRGITRITSLLGGLGLLDRIYYSEKQSYEEFTSVIKPINYSVVNDLLMELRVKSIKYLSNSVG